MFPPEITREELIQQVEELQARLVARESQLAESQETLRAIREGEVDALIVSTPQGQRIFTLQSADQTYRTIVEQMQEGAVTLMEDGRINYSNRRFAEIKRPLEQIVGSHFCEHLIEPDRGGLHRLLDQARGGAARGDLTLQSSDGTQVPVHVALGVVVVETVSSIGVVVTDLTERKRAEAVLASEQFVRRLIDNAPFGVAVVGRDLRYWLANPAYQSIADVPVVGRTIGEVFPPAVTQVFQPLIQLAFESGREMECRECEVPLRGRTWWNVSKIPLRDTAGNIEAVLILMQDVTEQKRAEEELEAARHSAEQAKAAAEHANRTKDHFLAVLSHELRTPLTPVVMGVSMLKDRPDLAPDTREMLESIHRNIEMEVHLIDDLLDVTRIARGKIELNRSPVELCTVIQRAVEVCRPDIEARRLHFGVDLGPSAPYWVEADVPRLQQVFWNLLRNAVKFTSHGGCVGIRCRPNEDHVVVEVNDSGIGIEPGSLSRVFNAFEQVERSITQQFGGLGLGLAISKALVEMHGGEIHAHSEGRGKGATFRIRLPLTAPAGQPEAPAPDVRPSRAVRPLRILLVEDHGVTAKIMKMMLTAEGHSVEIAGDLATALELVDQHLFDLLLSDLGLPDGSGHDLMRQLRERRHTFPGIALSGYGQEDDIQRSYDAGFDAHLTKPTSREAVVKAIASAIAGEATEDGTRPV